MEQHSLLKKIGGDNAERQKEKMNKRLFVSFVMAFAIAGALLIPVSVALGLMVLGMTSETTGVVGLAELAVIGICGTVIIVVMYIAKRTKKSPTFPRNSVMYTVISTAIFAKNSRYPVNMSRMKASPQNLTKCNGSPRGL